MRGATACVAFARFTMTSAKQQLEDGDTLQVCNILNGPVVGKIFVLDPSTVFAVEHIKQLAVEEARC